MLKFIFKGIIRDRSRSLLPIIVVSLGVFLTVLMTGWIGGIFNDMINMNANFSSGHVKIMTRSYAENESQIPNDLALLGVDSLMKNLKHDFPMVEWVERISFGGLVDVPNKEGETRAQGAAIGRGIDLFSPRSHEADRMNIAKAIVTGSMPNHPGQILISNEFAQKFNVIPGNEITLFGSTMNGSMMFQSFIVSGTVRFGTAILDKGALIMDIKDARQCMDMDNAASEILGFVKNSEYINETAQEIKNTFNTKYNDPKDEFAPLMFTLADLNGMGEYLVLADSMSTFMIFIFIFAMSIVLWNTGLLGGLRRYTEYGVRLALGEEKKHIYKTTIYEAIMIGIIGSVLGSALGIAASYYLQEQGLDFSAIMNNVTMMIPPVYRATVTPKLFYIGFIPGVLATVLGNALAGFAIYKRKTAQLFRELEV